MDNHGFTTRTEVLHAYLLNKRLLREIDALLAANRLNSIALRNSKGRTELEGGAMEYDGERCVIRRGGSRNELVELRVLIDANSNTLLRRTGLSSDEKPRDLMLALRSGAIASRPRETNVKSAVALTRTKLHRYIRRRHLVGQIECLLVLALSAILDDSARDLEALAILNKAHSNFVRITSKVRNGKIIASFHSDKRTSGERWIDLGRLRACRGRRKIRFIARGRDIRRSGRGV